jgi:hypothetical protein
MVLERQSFLFGRPVRLPGSVPLEIEMLARMCVGESGDRHAGVVNAHHSLEGFDVGVE